MMGYNCWAYILSLVKDQLLSIYTKVDPIIYWHGRSAINKS